MEPASASGIPEEVQVAARSLMLMPRNGSATASPSLWLRDEWNILQEDID